jgi:hypothetical protein
MVAPAAAAALWACMNVPGPRFAAAASLTAASHARRGWLNKRLAEMHHDQSYTLHVCLCRASRPPGTFAALLGKVTPHLCLE